MFPLYCKRCTHQDCNKKPSYGVEGSKTADVCAPHAKDGMVPVLKKRRANNKAATSVQTTAHRAARRQMPVSYTPREECSYPQEVRPPRLYEGPLLWCRRQQDCNVLRHTCYGRDDKNPKKKVRPETARRVRATVG